MNAIYWYFSHLSYWGSCMCWFHCGWVDHVTISNEWVENRSDMCHLQVKHMTANVSLPEFSSSPGMATNSVEHGYFACWLCSV